MSEFIKTLGVNTKSDPEHTAHLLSALIDTAVVVFDIKAGGTFDTITPVSIFDALLLPVAL